MTDVDPEMQIESFLSKYDAGVAAVARSARAALRARFPGAFELVYDNYNALAIGFGPSERTSEAVLSIAVYPRWVNLFFLYGAYLDDPGGVLAGSGKRVRHVRLASASDLSRPELSLLMKQATEDSPAMFEKRGVGAVIVKSVAANQRPRRARGDEPKRRGSKARSDERR